MAELKEKLIKSTFFLRIFIFGLWIALLREKANLLTNHILNNFLITYKLGESHEKHSKK
jgi:hypothetical protein